MWSALQNICRFDKLLATSGNEMQPGIKYVPQPMIQTSKSKSSSSMDFRGYFPDEKLSMLPFLPEDVLTTIFACCEAKDLLLGVALTCKKWRDIVTGGRVFLQDQWWSVPRDSSKWISEGKYYLKKKMWTPSITSFTRAVLLNPHDGNAFSYRATAYQKKGLYEEALKDFKRVLELNPKDASVVYNNRGFLYNKMGRFEDAMKENTKAIDIDPNDDIAYNNRGFAFNSMARFEEALYDYTRAIELDNMYSIAYNNRGYAYNSMGRYQEALGDYNRALELDPKRINTYNNRGYLFESLGRFEEALIDYNKALELDAEDTIAVNLKIALLRRMETVKKAKEEFIKQRTQFTQKRREIMNSLNSTLLVSY